MTQPSATGNTACHTGIDSASSHGPAQTLSFMEPASVPVATRPATVSVQVTDARRTADAQVSPSLDPPPPRLV